MKKIIYAAMLLLCLSIVGCQKEEPIVNISLDTTSLSLEEGTSKTLIATISPSNATNKNVVWSSNNNSVATVDNQGNVKAIMAGTAIITVLADGGKSATCSVSVSPKFIPVESISIDKSSVEVYIGDFQKVYATITPNNATNKNINWTSSDESIATIAYGVLICGKSKGEAIITAEIEGKHAECKVSVLPVIAKTVEIINPTTTMLLHETQTLSYKLSPTPSEDVILYWSSSNENVLTIDETGVCTALSEGSAIVSVYNEDKTLTDEVEIKVRDPYMKVGQEYISKWGLACTVESIHVYTNEAKMTCSISYTIKNVTPDKKLAECTFACRQASGSSEGQYGFYDYLYPGEATSRSYTFDTLSSDPFVELVFVNTFRNETVYPDAPDLVWDLTQYQN